MLSPNRAVDIDSWNKVGKSLCFIHNNDEQGLRIFIQFTQRVRTDEQCSNVYLSSDTGFIYLVLYAKQDNPTLFEAWYYDWVKCGIEAASNGSPLDVAVSLFRLFWVNYFYNITNHKWYKFQDNTYIRQEGSSDLSKLIRGGYLNYIEQIRSGVLEAYMKESNIEKKSGYDLMNEKLRSLIRKLTISGFITKIMDEAKKPFSSIGPLQRPLPSSRVVVDPALSGIPNLEELREWYSITLDMDLVQQCDNIFVFINAEIQQAYQADGETIDDKCSLTQTELFDKYKRWLRSDERSPLKQEEYQEIKEGFHRILGPQKGRRWYGIKMKEGD